MPIKSCSLCGLKVLVDASQAASDNYVCPRCAPDAKPAPAPRPAGGRRPTVKLACPYCGASFSGSIPSRPAKGGCPVCQKELVLLPDGTIQAAATFNLQQWQKERKSASSPSAVRAPAPQPVAEAPPEMPSTPDPLGGSTILDMGGPPGSAPPAPMPSLDEPTMAMPGGLGGETMLGMGSDLADRPPPPPTIEETESPSEPELESEPPPEMDESAGRDAGTLPVEMPPPAVEEPPPEPDLLTDMMPGMDRPPAAESPVEPPIAPPIPEEPEPEPDVTEGPTIRDSEEAPPEEPAASEEEPVAASIESAPEIPGDLGGQTILDMGGTGDVPSREPEPAPSIEETPPEAVPILAKDVASDEPPDSEAPPESAGVKGHVYQPISRSPRKPPGVPAAPPSPAAPPPRAQAPMSSPPPPPSSGSAPVLGSDFRIASVPPEPKPPEKGEAKPAGPRTAAVALPRAQHSFSKMVLAWVLLLLPLGVGFALYSFQKVEVVKKFIDGITNEALPGIQKIEGEVRKAIAKPPEPPPESK